MVLGACADDGLQQSLRADSQGTSGLREGLAGVTLSSGHWQHQVQGHEDLAMHEVCAEHPAMQLQDACAEQDAAAAEAQHLMQSPVAEFDSADTAAAAAAFEAHLAACCGDRDSQEAVFKAWLDALLPHQGDQEPQQQLPAQQGGVSPEHQPQQQASGSPQEGMYHQQQEMQVQCPVQQHGFGEGDLPPDFDDEVDAAAAAALHMAAQRAAEEPEGLQEAGHDALNPEEDFRELLDLLLDA